MGFEQFYELQDMTDFSRYQENLWIFLFKCSNMTLLGSLDIDAVS